MMRRRSDSGVHLVFVQCDSGWHLEAIWQPMSFSASLSSLDSSSSPFIIMETKAKSALFKLHFHHCCRWHLHHTIVFINVFIIITTIFYQLGIVACFTERGSHLGLRECDCDGAVILIIIIIIIIKIIISIQNFDSEFWKWMVWMKMPKQQERTVYPAAHYMFYLTPYICWFQ